MRKGWAVMKGWYFGKDYPSDFNRPFGRFMHSRLVEHYVRTSEDLFVLEVLESVSDLAIVVKKTVPKRNRCLTRENRLFTRGRSLLYIAEN